MNVTGFQHQHGHLLAWVDLGPSQVVWAFHPGQVPAIESAVDALRCAVMDAVTLQMLEAVPAAPDHPPLVKPCRICDQRTADNEDDERGLTFCPDHRPKGST